MKTPQTSSTDKYREAAQKIVRQNVRMAVNDEPFFGLIALSLPWFADYTCPTMATDGTCFLYNPGFVLEMSDKEVKAVAIHEILHVALLHPLRLGGRDPFIANMAMDYAINLYLIDAGYKLPQGALVDEGYRNMSWEQVYGILIQQRKGNPPDCPINPRPSENPGGPSGNDKSTDCPINPRPSGNPGSPSGKRDYSNGDVLPSPGSAEKRRKIEEEIGTIVVQAESNAKAAGQMPGGLRDILLKSRDPEEDYRHLFDKFIAPIYPRDYTWQRPSRRFIGQGIYLPSVLKDGVGELMVAVDTSGSISHEVLENFVGMINHFLTRVRPEKLHVVYCDACVYKHEQFKPGAPMELDGHQVQSGGTRFSPVFRYAQDNDIKPKCCVYLTDLECYDFGPEPDYPVLWMQYGEYRNTRLPFGQVVKIKTTVRV